jgi:hypothetical protein
MIGPRPATLCAVKRRVVAGVVMALASAAALGACGEADNTYVEEQGSGLFLRLPTDWAVFQVEDGKPASDPQTDVDFGPWSVLIDGAAEPDRGHGEQAVPDEPVGTVQVVPLALFQSRPALAHSTLRMFFTSDGTDPLEAGLGDVRYEEIDLGDHWGNRITATIEQGGAAVRATQLAFFDSGGDRVHVVRITCSVECYEEREDEIEAIVDSFTLEG